LVFSNESAQGDSGPSVGSNLRDKLGNKHGFPTRIVVVKYRENARGQMTKNELKLIGNT
jgi:hypothetical protein